VVETIVIDKLHIELIRKGNKVHKLIKFWGIIRHKVIQIRQVEFNKLNKEYGFVIILRIDQGE